MAAQFRPKFTSAQHAGVLATEAEIIQREKLGFTRWVNMYLKPRKVTVNDLFKDLADGNILAHLMEVLSGESVQTYGRMKFPADMRIQQIANLSVVFSFMKQHVKLVSIGPQDILEGDEKRILGLIWTLIEHFAVIMINAHLQTDIRSYAELKETLLLWARHKVSNDRYRLEVQNFTEALSDGRVFLALLNDGNPKECPYAPTSRPSANLATAFRTAERVYGLVPMMDHNDPYATQCEQVSIIYMASLYLALPSEFDTLVMRVQIYLRVLRWWRRIQPAVHFRKTLMRARIACWAQRCLARWRYDKERMEMVGIRAQWLAQKGEISTLRQQLEKMRQMYSEVGKKASALPEVMGKFSELQSYAKSLKLEYERRITELEDHIEKMSAAEEGHTLGREEAETKAGSLQEQLRLTKEDLGRAQNDLAELAASHAEVQSEHGKCDGVTLRLTNTIEEQAARIADLEAQLEGADEAREQCRVLQAELEGRDTNLAENEDQLEEMEEHVENLSAAMVASEEQARKLQEALDAANAERAELEAKFGESEARNGNLETEITDRRAELADTLRKLEAVQDEVAELTTENQDVKSSNDRIDALNEELRDAVTRLTEEKRALESTRESLKDAIEDMQASAKAGTEAADKCLVDLGRDFERARAKLGQLRTSFDGRSVIDDVVCLQHVTKLLATELEGSVLGHREALAQLADWRTRHATKTTEHAELARAHSDAASTKEQLLARNEELEAEAERLRKEYDEAEYALAESTSKWMHLEQERGFFANTAKKINRHAIASLKSGQLAGILVSSVSLALEDLAAVKMEAVSSALGGGGSALGKTRALGFLDAPSDEGEKGEVVWAEELIQMVCTEVDGLRRVIREREIALAEKTKEVAELEAARLEIAEMRNETEAARDAFYEHKEAWERSITAELTAQVSALRQQVASYEDDASNARRSASEFVMGRTEQEAALERLRVVAKSREDELVDQLEALALKHTSETGRLKQDLAAAEAQLEDQLRVLESQRAESSRSFDRLEDQAAENSAKARHLARLEATARDLEARLEESEKVAGRARSLAREKGDLEGRLRALEAEHEVLENRLASKASDFDSTQLREQEKEYALETAAARYMQQQTLLDELRSRSEELTKHAQAALVKLTSLKAGGDSVGKLDRESEIYRAELEANMDLNPALAELMFARHLMNRLESHVFALREEDAIKTAEFAAVNQDVTSTRAEMEELLDSHQGVVQKMKTLQDRARSINESLREKGAALDEATATIDELEAKQERLLRMLEAEKKNHTQTKLECDEVSATLESSRADYEAEILELKERLQLQSLRASDLEGSAAVSAELAILRRKLEEKERVVKESQHRLKEAEARNREMSAEISALEERAAELRSKADALKGKKGDDSHSLREQVVILQNEKEMAEQDVTEISEAYARLEADARNPRLLSVRRAGQMQHIMYEIEDLESKDLDGEGMTRLRKLHEDLINIFDDTLCYLKGGMVNLVSAEAKKLESTMTKCKDAAQCKNIFKEAHLSCKKIVVSVAPSNNSVSNAHWTIPNMAALDEVPDNKYMELLKNIRNLLVAHDMMDDSSRSKLSTFVEIMMNLDWLVILGHKALDVEMARKSKAMRRAYGNDSASAGGDYGARGGSDAGSAHSGQLSYKRGSARGR